MLRVEWGNRRLLDIQSGAWVAYFCESGKDRGPFNHRIRFICSSDLSSEFFCPITKINASAVIEQ